MNTLHTYQDLQKKIATIREKGPDLSTEEDLAVAIMNLISLEEHFFFTGAKTEKPAYYDLLVEVRDMRKTLLARMLPKTEGEAWCISKHLLSTSMRLMEVGTKLQSGGADGKNIDKKGAEEMFRMAYKTFNLFFALRLNIINAPQAANMLAAEKPMSFDDIMKKLVDCCKE